MLNSNSNKNYKTYYHRIKTFNSAVVYNKNKSIK